MKEKISLDIEQFINLPPETQVKIIGLIDDDKTLMSFLSASQSIYSNYVANRNLIFSYRVHSLVTEQKVMNAYKIYLDYKKCQGMKSPYVNDIKENHTPLSYMVFKGFEKAVAIYLNQMESREGLLHKVRHNYNLVHLAILSGNLDMLKLILAQPEAQHLINEADSYLAKPIHFVAKTANQNFLECLVTHPSFDKNSMNAEAQYLYTPLAYYCMYSDKDDVSFVKKMIEYGADKNEMKRINGLPCVIAIQKSKPAVGLYLCQFAKDQLNRSTVNIAIEKGCTEIALFLMTEYKLEPKVECNFVYSLLKRAVDACDCKLMEIAFKFEKPIYDELAKEKSEYILPSLNDYLLTAMESMLSNRAGEKTQAVYSKLLELGFCFTMHDSYENKNIIDVLKKNIANFTWGKEEIYGFAKPIIQDILERFKLTVPIAELADYEKVEKYLIQSAELTRLEYEKAMAEMPDFSNNTEMSHDDQNKCVIC